MEISVKTNKFKDKVNKVKSGVKSKTEKVIGWAKEHPDKAIIVAVGIVQLTGAIPKTITSIGDAVLWTKDAAIAGCKIWDPTNGLFWVTKKPLTGAQKLEFESLVKGGVDRGEALNIMGVLRKG